MNTRMGLDPPETHLNSPLPRSRLAGLAQPTLPQRPLATGKVGHHHHYSSRPPAPASAGGQPRWARSAEARASEPSATAEAVVAVVAMYGYRCSVRQLARLLARARADSTASLTYAYAWAVSDVCGAS